MRWSSRLASKALFVCALSSGIAAAQSPAVNSNDAAYATQQQQQQRSQPLNNQPVWSEVRSGLPQFTSIPGRETNVLIQPSGQTWRSLRNSGLSVYGGWALVGLFLLIAAFYSWRGTMQLHAPPTGRSLQRFSPWERAVHWSTAGSFTILALSGLVMVFGKSVLLPLVGYTLFSWLATLAKNLHNFVGPLFAICIVLIFVTFVRDNFPQRGDWQWIRNFGGMISGNDTPSWRFNAGEKLWFWGGATVLGIVVSAAGFVLDFPNFNQTRQTMQLAHVVHLSGSILFMLGAMGHIYMGTLGMAGAYAAMRWGYVDEEWAREHHYYWYEQVKSRSQVPPAHPLRRPPLEPLERAS